MPPYYQLTFYHLPYMSVAGPPQTAEEYLQWVRHEAQQCPRVMRKEIDPAKLAAAEAASNTRAATASASAPSSTTGRGGAAAAAGGPGRGAGSGSSRRAGQGPKTHGVKRAGEGIERGGIDDEAHEEGPDEAGEEWAGENGGGGGGSLAAVRASATARAYSLLAAAPGACGCSEWARPNPKWLRVFVQVGHGAGAHVVTCLWRQRWGSCRVEGYAYGAHCAGKGLGQALTRTQVYGGWFATSKG